MLSEISIHGLQWCNSTFLCFFLSDSEEWEGSSLKEERCLYFRLGLQDFHPSRDVPSSSDFTCTFTMQWLSFVWYNLCTHAIWNLYTCSGLQWCDFTFLGFFLFVSCSDSENLEESSLEKECCLRFRLCLRDFPPSRDSPSSSDPEDTWTLPHMKLSMYIC